MIKEFSAAIFDLDGTLLDSMSLWEDIDTIWLKKNNIEPTACLLKKFKTMDFSQAADFSINILGLPFSEDELISEWTSMALRAYSKDITLKPYAREILTKYKNSGKKLVLATSCQKSCCEAVINKEGIADYFDLILYGSKDSPDIYLNASEYLNLPPEKCVVFDDIYNALISAHKAGMQFVAVHDKLSGIYQEKMKKEAELYIESFFELL